MWNDRIKERMVDKSVSWQLWNGEISREEVVSELEKGRRFVISCSEYCYLDLPYALTSLEKCYNFNPVPDGLSDEGLKNLMGVEACLWTEFVPDMLTADRMTYPRLAAISETGWSQKEKKSFDTFLKKLGCYYSLLGVLGVKAQTLKKTMPSGVSKLAGKLYWERRKLCWGAHQNILSDLRVRGLGSE